MGAIYAAAQLTLIACGGEGPSHGLSGVSRDRQYADAFERVGPFTLIQARPNNQDEQLHLSAWASRAW